MANTDLKTFLQDRLRALDPSIDLDVGSPAQVQFIEPVLRRLGTDPFETDVGEFILARFRQEFPDVYAEDPSVINDVFVKPLIVLLEPLKREIQLTRRNQSLADPSVLSDDEADALVANVFEYRSAGGRASGVVRVFFSQPTALSVDVTARAYTAGGLGFYPAAPAAISAEQMIFNRQGNLFFFDLTVRAESEGAEYNVAPDSIIGIDGIANWVRATNPRKFDNGSAKVDTETFVAQAGEALNERSLNTRRGAIARLRGEFSGDARAFQVIGAGDVEMQRDLLVCTSPGHAWLAGKVSLYGNLAMVRCSMIDGRFDDAPKPGDTVFFYIPVGTTTLAQEKRFIRLRVEEIFAGPLADTPPYQALYIVRWSGSLPDGFVPDNRTVFDGGFERTPSIKISSISDGASVRSGEVHVLGHTDIYVRPSVQTTSKAVLDGLSDAGPLVERTTLMTEAGDNVAADAVMSFSTVGVKPGDILLIESGADAGAHVIQEVYGGLLYLSAPLTTTASGIRYRVVQRLRINPFDPQVLKFPFGDVPANDLVTNVGSNLFLCSSNNPVAFGVAVGDTIRILDGGTDEAEFTITGFDSTYSGRGLLVDRPASGSNSGLRYRIYRKLEPIQRPLVRVRELLVLDSAKQTTSVSIPPADPVAVVPTGDFTSARVKGKSQRRTGFVLPDLSVLGLEGGSMGAAGGGVYSLGLEPATGTYRAVTYENGTQREIDFRADAFGECSYFVATVESDDDAENFPPISPRPGECLTIKSGPNKGSYLIEEVRKLSYAHGTTKTNWVYFIKIHGTFPVDAFKHLTRFLEENGVSVQKLGVLNGVDFPGFFLQFYDALPGWIAQALPSGVPSPETVRAAVDQLLLTDYEWGEPSRGVIRTYFQEPVLFEQRTGDRSDPTVFEGDGISFRPDPHWHDEHQLVPTRLYEDSDVLTYPRDLEAAGTDMTFTDSSRPPMIALGVRPGDVMDVHEETVFYGSAQQQAAVMTNAGSSVIRTVDPIFTKEMVGNLVFVEAGDDVGGYRIASFVDDRTVVLDRAMTGSTPPHLLRGLAATGARVADKNLVTVTDAVSFNAAFVGRWITLFTDPVYSGSYRIKAVVSAKVVEVEHSVDFPATPFSAVWAVTEAPAKNPTVNGAGTELVAVRPIRVYDDVARSFGVVQVGLDPATSQVVLDGSPRAGVRMPYRLYRKNVRRVNPTEMKGNQEGPLFYFDTQVVSLGASPDHNIKKGTYLTVKEGTYRSFGYRHVVSDPTRSYSTEEEGFLDLPVQVLPVGSPDSAENMITLAGGAVQVTYERADIVTQLQAFILSGQDRVTAANMLARHLLPAFVSYDARYYGGSKTDVVAKKIIEYLDGVGVENAIDVSKLEEIIIRAGGNPETPTRAYVVLHDWNRRVWAEFGENTVGGTALRSPISGSSRVVTLVPGQDASTLDPVPTGERIRLTRP